MTFQAVAGRNQSGEHRRRRRTGTVDQETDADTERGQESMCDYSDLSREAPDRVSSMGSTGVVLEDGETRNGCRIGIFS